MSAAFVHLHTHSCYSFLDGVPSPADLAQAAARLGMPALALTDHHGLAGAVEFYQACQSVGVRPILGLELTVAPPAGWLDTRPGSLVLLAQDLLGWGSLCRLSTAVLGAEQPPEAGLPLERLARDSLSLICLTGGRRGTLARLVRARHDTAAAHWLGRLRDLFGDRLYVELNPGWPSDGSDLNERLVHWARAAGLPVVASGNVHTLEPEDSELQRLLTAVRLNTTVDRLPPEASAPPGTCFVSGQALLQQLAVPREAIARAAEVAERCRLDLPLGVPHYPAVALPPGRTALEALRERAIAGAQRRYGALTPEIVARLDHELAVIGQRGYAPLFLIMQEVLAYARRTGVPTSSRGSAASSLVAHCLEITAPDPLRLNLYFERFLNPARSSPPDIDTDLCSRRRDSVIQHVYDTYGRDRVAMVSTVMRYRERSALREAAKALGFSAAEISVLADALPRWGWAPPGAAEPPAAPPEGVARGYAVLAAERADARHQRLFRLASRLLGLPRHLSVHPGGVVIAPGPLTDLVPCQLASKGVVITQFDLDDVSRLGLVKIDLLGIRGLTVLGDMAEVLARQPGAPATTPLEALEAIPAGDAVTQALVQAGRTIGCFQIESPGMRATLREIAARSVDDLMVALALYRPGPLTGGLKDAFVRRHLGREPVRHLHPALAPLLADTFGIFLYQEQVLRVAHELAGLTLAEADLLRRAMSHFDPGREMQTLRQRFLDGAAARHGLTRELAERVWDLMAAFAGYGFPKAHAASYAQVAWRAAWCKAHFPAEFMAAVLANWGGYYSQRVYLTEARRLGLRLRPPHVNYSGREFAVVAVAGEKRLYMGLNQVKELSARTQARILRERPFASLADFLARADPRPQEAHNLARVGAFDGLGTIPGLLGELKAGSRRPGQLVLFAAEPAPAGDWSLADKVAAQEALLGVGVEAHPLELVADRIEQAGAVSTVVAAGRLGQKVRVAGMRQSWRRVATSRGDFVYFMALEDLEGMLDVVLFGDVYRRHRAALAEPGPYVLEGVVELDAGRGEPAIRAERVWPL